MDNLGYLLAVFIVAWLGLFIYILVMVNNQKKLQKAILSLKEELKEKGLGG
jgi:CcmD family protein